MVVSGVVSVVILVVMLVVMSMVMLVVMLVVMWVVTKMSVVTCPIPTHSHSCPQLMALKSASLLAVQKPLRQAVHTILQFLAEVCRQRLCPRPRLAMCPPSTASFALPQHLDST